MSLPIAPLSTQPTTNSRSNLPSGWWLPLLVLLLLVVFQWDQLPDFLQFDEDGNPALSPERLGKLGRELDELEHAEQYVLRASKDGHYPCYNCGEKMTIFLRRGEVFKYGVTRKGEQGRYGNWHSKNYLVYAIQYEGQMQECFRQEKIKIYNYALLPENIRRKVPLIRPPGNKQDN